MTFDPFNSVNSQVPFNINSSPNIDGFGDNDNYQQGTQSDSALKKLYESSGQETLVYPREILEDKNPHHFIMFQAYNVKGISVEETRQAVEGAIELTQETAGDIGQDAIQDQTGFFPQGLDANVGIFEELQEIATSPGGLQQTDRIINQNNSLASRFKTTSKTDILGKQKELADTIVLYMPNELSVSYGADYAMDNTEVASGIRAAMDTFKAGAGATARQQADTSKALKDILVNAGVKLGKASLNLFGQDLNGTVGSLSRKVLNPHLEFLFQQINQRSFSYTFAFTPRSQQEAEMVHRIIKKFKFYAHPVFDSKSTFLTMPAEFDIIFYSSNKENKYLNRVMPCALTGIEVNYTPDGIPSFFKDTGSELGQSPTNIIVTLQFSEIGLLDRRHIEAGY